MGLFYGIGLHFEGEDVSAWLYIFEKIARISGWNAQEAVDFAELAMCSKAKHCIIGLLTTGAINFAMLKQRLLNRFGESQTMSLSRLEHRKQRPDENVHDYIDAMQLPFTKTSYPVAGQANCFMSNLNRDRVVNGVPSSFDEAIKCALWFEDRDLVATPEQAGAERHTSNIDTDISRASFQALQRALASWVLRSNPKDSLMQVAISLADLLIIRCTA